ncbi:deoxyguanosinetriphosphate triphosphohydrolase [Frankia sp. CNm7]|uniref:Deoxyguanosinetriphosphate triphosphohydrolase n=1 Tax=Frankia nepalensis TaxID=1836974 RepID=A0A937URR6_9ACTN|nr:deoxyguanosinetriphosphate triphosphohydrolase [Frankia nepalensis]MBL7495029.1 deoxyguanosinetriphosphate triphosphohydrolase [Frankia nepalensis]MBL7516181.1 deoxyguanosinetriphosphate triphosphohydrolase [Frankia nepalensis]MBL7520135.1 deoxyguanosinetriphosphate triphosphohydrolase [Frankia nepalensis]MBL7633119.1 deoxyguanosinetriphosphate triphosphohydrolase [Frankia nepalensis]
MTWYDDADGQRRLNERRKATPDDRGWFARDRARVLHSSALRRLAAKTQVMGPLDDDFPRTRLTHSLETAQIGRELAAALGADPDLVDAACLAHDLGHPPFGHNGERALNLAAAACGGFEGNAQSFRELTRLEAKVVDETGVPGGLNLTRATLDATLKYPWPGGGQVGGAASGCAAPDLTARKYGVYVDDGAAFAWVRSGAPGDRRCLEAQVMDWADDVAYSVHDLEDGVVGGLVDLAATQAPAGRAELAEYTAGLYHADAAEIAEALARLAAEPWWGAPIPATAPGLAALRTMTSELVARFSAAARAATLARYGPGPLRRYQADLVVPADVRAECLALKGVAWYFVIGLSSGDARRARQREVIAELVELTAAGAPGSLEPLLRPAWHAARDDPSRLRVVIDQVARLTDASASRRHAELLGRPGWVGVLADLRSASSEPAVSEPAMSAPTDPGVGPVSGSARAEVPREQGEPAAGVDQDRQG